MSNPRDPDSGLEELLRSSLHGEAETISPSGDGLARIQQRTAVRGRRLWLRPVAVVGGAAVAAAAGFTAYAVTAANHGGNDTLVSPQPTVIPSTAQTAATPTATPSSTPPAGPVFPAKAFYPFTSAAQEQSWEAQHGPVVQPWVTDPVAEAKDFARTYVLAADVKDVMGTHIAKKTASVTLGRVMSDASSKLRVSVTTVMLQRFAKAWLVVGAVDPKGNLKVTTPYAGTHVTSPVTVSGPSFGVEERIDVAVTARGDYETRVSQISFGNGSAPWSISVPFAQPADPRGAILVRESSLADGGTARISATAVTFDSEQTGYPQYFYAVKNNRIAKLSARTGAAIAYVTPPTAADTTLSDPQVLNGQLIYISNVGSCHSELRTINTDGSNSQTDVAADAGYAITGYAARYNHALYETACSPATSPAAKIKFVLNANDPPAPAANTTTFQAVPPGVVGDPTWSDLRHLTAILRTGTANSLVDYDSWTAQSASDGTAACTGNNTHSEPDAVAADTSGNLWFAARTGDAMQVVRCMGPTARLMFTVAGNRQPADISVAGGGGAVLLTDTDGHVWRWTMGGSVVQLTPSVPITQLAW